MWSIAVQYAGANGYSPASWQGRKAYVQEHASKTCDSTVLIDGETVCYTFNNDVAKKWGKLRMVSANLDYEEWRHRLWSLRDSELVYLYENWEAAKLERKNANEREKRRHQLRLNSLVYHPLEDKPYMYYVTGKTHFNDEKNFTVIKRRKNFQSKFGIGLGPFPKMNANAKNTRIAHLHWNESTLSIHDHIISINGIQFQGEMYQSAMQECLEKTHHDVIIIIQGRRMNKRRNALVKNAGNQEVNGEYYPLLNERVTYQQNNGNTVVTLIELKGKLYWIMRERENETFKYAVRGRKGDVIPPRNGWNKIVNGTLPNPVIEYEGDVPPIDAHIL
eukprot:g270.t1